MRALPSALVVLVSLGCAQSHATDDVGVDAARCPSGAACDSGITPGCGQTCEPCCAGDVCRPGAACISGICFSGPPCIDAGR